MITLNAHSSKRSAYFDYLNRAKHSLKHSDRVDLCNLRSILKRSEIRERIATRSARSSRLIKRSKLIIIKLAKPVVLARVRICVLRFRIRFERVLVIVTERESFVDAFLRCLERCIICRERGSSRRERNGLCSCEGSFVYRETRIVRCWECFK